MISEAKQLGDKINLRTDKGKLIIRNGYLISFTENRLSYIAAKTSKTVLVIDDNGRYIHSYNVTKEFASGLGW